MYVYKNWFYEYGELFKCMEISFRYLLKYIMFMDISFGYLMIFVRVWRLVMGF